jgi:alpha-glucosidase
MANAPNAGFSPANIKTWLPVNPNYAHGVNVADQEKEPDSLLNFYKRILSLRRRTPALINGNFQVINPKSRNYLAFLRQSQEEDQTCLVVLNMSADN